MKIIQKTILFLGYVLATSLLALTLFSCESEKDVQSNIEQLKKERESIRGQISNYEATFDSMKIEKESVQADLEHMNLIKSGKTPRYLLKLELKQSHMSLSISEHVKDNMNAVELVVPVDFEYYKSVKVGQQIVNEFRTGSFIMSGSIGDWEVTVIEKKVI